MVRKHQTSDAQLRIGESRDSGLDAEPVIGPARGRTRWHRPGMTGVFYAAMPMPAASSAARRMLEDISLVTVLCSSTAAAVDDTYSFTL